MASDEAELLRLAITAHESPSDPRLWPQFLEECAHGQALSGAGDRIHCEPQEGLAFNDGYIQHSPQST